MIHVVTQSNLALYGLQLDQMFRMRHEYYVEGHGWRDLASENGREVDAYDNEEAVYLLAFDSEGDVASALRLNPTLGPNLTRALSETFITGDAPFSANIWDMTRWMIAPRFRGLSSSRSVFPGHAMGCGLMEWAMSHGLTHISTIAESRLVKRLDQIGWTYHALGPSQSYDNGAGAAQAVLIEVSQEMLNNIRDVTRVDETVLCELYAEPMDLESNVPITTATQQLRGLAEIIGDKQSQKLLSEHLITNLAMNEHSIDKHISSTLLMADSLQHLFRSTIFSASEYMPKPSTSIRSGT